MPANIQDILAEYAVPYVGADHKHGRPGWVQVDCPWCHTAGSYHLGVSLSSGACACWRCGTHNTARALAMLTGQPAGRMRERLDGAAMVEAPAAPAGKLVLPAGRGELAGCHRAYLAQRGLDATEVAATWGVGGIKMAGGKWRQLSWRLFIPIYHRGEVVSWTTRSIKRGGQRYLSAGAQQEAVPHKSILYGADLAGHAIIIHEGPIDCWATGPGAVATCGTAYTQAQLRAMARYPVRVVCFDSSEDAQARARVLARDLAAIDPAGTTHAVELETGEDAADASKEELAELRDTYL